MNTTQTPHQTQIAASRQKLEEVVKAGETLGFWKLGISRQDDGAEAWRYATVITPLGHTFGISGGSWGREGSISCGLADIAGPNGVRVGLRESTRYSEVAPEASCTYTRPADVIAKDLNKRVCTSPKGVEIGQRMVDTLAVRVADWGALRGHMESLKPLGYTFDRIAAGETYSAKGWTSRPDIKPRNVTVYASGRVAFEAEVHAKDMTAVVALLSRTTA